MNETDYNARLYEKMKAEQDKYRDWLVRQEPSEILNHTYEYTMREDIVMCMEELELEPEKARALLRSPCPLSDFVVTSLEYQSVRECMYYGENILTKFPERIIFSLGSNDADNLIENVSVAGLRDNTVYFTDGVKNTFQMKPYITPSANELKKLFD